MESVGSSRKKAVSDCESWRDSGDDSVCGSDQEIGCRSGSEPGNGVGENSVDGGSASGWKPGDSVGESGNESVRMSYCLRTRRNEIYGGFVMTSVTHGRSGFLYCWRQSCRCCWSERSCGLTGLFDQR